MRMKVLTPSPNIMKYWKAKNLKKDLKCFGRKETGHLQGLRDSDAIIFLINSSGSWETVGEYLCHNKENNFQLIYILL